MSKYQRRPHNGGKHNRNRFGSKSRYNSGKGWSNPRRSRGRFNKTKIDRSRYINDDIEIKAQGATYEGSSYDEFSFETLLSQNLSHKGFKRTTEIQDKAIPKILSGRDILGISETGSGKTGAFLIPMINKVLSRNDQKLLVVAPTRELAQQITREAISMVKGSNIYVSQIVGGESIGRQISQIRRGDQIVVGTPGRIIDLMDRKVLDLQKTNNFVIDEVDRMLDMGFIKDVKQIFASTSSERQALFFSATHNPKVEETVGVLTQGFEVIKLAGSSPVKSVKQDVIDYTDTSEKALILEQLLNRDEVKKAIIFVETKRFADRVQRELTQKNFKVDAIHGNKRQNVRNRVIAKFKNSDVDYLVATNVAARGIDIDDITHVINYDEPNDYDEYIHRIGRTGRNGKMGTAYTFVQKR